MFTIESELPLYTHWFFNAFSLRWYPKKYFLITINYTFLPSPLQSCPRVKRKDSMRVTAMSVTVITVFLMIEIPLMVITMLHALSTKEAPLLDYGIANNIILVINSFMCLSCPLNLAIYCGMSKQFRENLYIILHWHNTPSNNMTLLARRQNNVEPHSETNLIVKCPYIQELNRVQEARPVVI